MLYLIRHSGVTPKPELPGPQWHLSPEGRTAAETLAAEPYWSELRGMHTSVEPKAIATAQRIAAPNDLPIRIERELREVEGRVWVESGYETLVRGYLGGESPDGWEPLDQARARVRGCIDGIVERHNGLHVGIVSHGIVLTLYVSDVLGLSSSEAVELWGSIRFPDVAMFDPEAKRFEQEFGS